MGTQQCDPPSLLGRWYADPLSQRDAAERIAQAERRLGDRLRVGRRCRLCPLARLIGRFWLGQEVENDYRQLAARARTRREAALIELVFGQLLVSRRLTGAHDHLRAAFNRAARLFSPGDYFTVLERHKTLRHLPLCAQPAAPRPLSELLAAGRVIERLEQAGAAGRPTQTQGTS